MRPEESVKQVPPIVSQLDRMAADILDLNTAVRELYKRLDKAMAPYQPEESKDKEVTYQTGSNLRTRIIEMRETVVRLRKIVNRALDRLEI